MQSRMAAEYGGKPPQRSSAGPVSVAIEETSSAANFAEGQHRTG